MAGWVINASDHAVTDGPQITVVAIVMTALALTTVLLRIYVRFGIIRASGIGKLWLVRVVLVATGRLTYALIYR